METDVDEYSGDKKNNSLRLALKYARIFVPGRHLSSQKRSEQFSESVARGKL